MICFGTGGWRAEIGSDFTKDNVCKVGQGICDYMRNSRKTDKPVIVGYDRRFLSDKAARWVAEVLAANDVDVYLLNRSAPTPLIMHTVKDKHLQISLALKLPHFSVWGYSAFNVFIWWQIDFCQSASFSTPAHFVYFSL